MKIMFNNYHIILACTVIRITQQGIFVSRSLMMSQEMSKAKTPVLILTV